MGVRLHRQTDVGAAQGRPRWPCAVVDDDRLLVVPVQRELQRVRGVELVEGRRAGGVDHLDEPLGTVGPLRPGDDPARLVRGGRPSRARRWRRTSRGRWSARPQPGGPRRTGRPSHLRGRRRSAGAAGPTSAAARRPATSVVDVLVVVHAGLAAHPGTVEGQVEVDPEVTVPCTWGLGSPRPAGRPRPRRRSPPTPRGRHRPAPRPGRGSR